MIIRKLEHEVEKASERGRLSQDLIKSKQRIADHGEVFTPPWLVEEMLDLTEESNCVTARFLEPACGSGNFLTRILQRKLSIVDLEFRKADYEKQHFSLVAVMSIYGIELLKDNITECRKRMLDVFANYMQIGRSDELYRTACYVLSQNLVHGDTLKMRTSDDRPIIFAEWEYLGKGKFSRRDFRFDLLTLPFNDGRKHKKLEPVRVYPKMAMSEIIIVATHSQNQGKASSEERKNL